MNYFFSQRSTKYFIVSVYCNAYVNIVLLSSGVTLSRIEYSHSQSSKERS